MTSPFSSPLFCLLQSYDLEREAYIKSLVSEENTKLKEQLSEAMGLLDKGEVLRDQLMLKAIVSGAFDGLQQEKTKEIRLPSGPVVCR